jgi:hypothetical protein
LLSDAFNDLIKSFSVILEKPLGIWLGPAIIPNSINFAKLGRLGNE